MDIFGRFVRDPSCLVAIDAADGGTWRSSFRPGFIYPASPSGSGSFEERTGLIAKTNIKTSNGYFESNNTSIPARIETPLDLRGCVSSYTSVVRFTAATLTSANQKQELTGQCPSITTGAYRPICSLAYAYNGTNGLLQLSQEIAGLRVAMTRSVPQLAGMHVVAGLISLSATQTRMSIYLDGVQLGTATAYAGLPTGISSSTGFSINDNRNGELTNFFGKFHNALLFDRVLSSGEIQLLR